MSENGLYERDFYAWAQEQATLLRQGRLTEADIAHIAEEIDSMGRTEKRELISRLTVLLLHLLKWQHQPSRRSTSWRLSIEEQRFAVDDHMADNPSLKAVLDEAMTKAYRVARLGAERETGLDENVFPSSCPWTYEQATDTAFWPE